MGDIRNPRLLYAKGALFLGIGVLASTLLLMEVPTLKATCLLTLAVWAFCRAYYFAFYVVEHYIDPSYRFAGLTSFVRYALRRSRTSRPGEREDPRAAPRDPSRPGA